MISVWNRGQESEYSNIEYFFRNYPLNINYKVLPEIQKFAEIVLKTLLFTDNNDTQDVKLNILKLAFWIQKRTREVLLLKWDFNISSNNNWEKEVITVPLNSNSSLFVPFFDENWYKTYIWNLVFSFMIDIFWLLNKRYEISKLIRVNNKERERLLRICDDELMMKYKILENLLKSKAKWVVDLKLKSSLYYEVTKIRV